MTKTSRINWRWNWGTSLLIVCIPDNRRHKRTTCPTAPLYWDIFVAYAVSLPHFSPSLSLGTHDTTCNQLQHILLYVHNTPGKLQPLHAPQKCATCLPSP